MIEEDRDFLRRVYDLALRTEAEGNLPIAAILVYGETVIAEGTNRALSPSFHPGRHAEVETLRQVPDATWKSAGELTLYTSLEPCLMCFGTIVLHRLGRVVFAAADPRGGALSLIPHLPDYVRAKAEAIRWEGPAWPERFDPLARRALKPSQGSPPGLLCGPPVSSLSGSFVFLFVFLPRSEGIQRFL